MKGYRELKIKDKKVYKEKFVSLFFKDKIIVNSVLPGNFFMLKTGNSSLILPRPFSIGRVFKEDSVFEINFEVVGKGTKALSEKKAGEFIQILGPLGNSFPIHKFSRVLLLGGGRGISPFLYMVKLLKEMKKELKLLYAAKTEKEILFINYLYNFNTEFITEDGSLGKKGLLTDYLTYGWDAVFACGPEVMMEKVYEFYKDTPVETYFSLEERMGCGTGVCYGCAKKLKINGKIKMVRICVEGPVFKGEEIFF